MILSERFRSVVRCFSFLVLVGTSVHVQGQGAVELRTVAEKEKEVLNAQGQVERRLVPAGTVVPGEEVIYTIYFTNVSGNNADNVVIVDPVPENMVYKDGTAFGPGTEITFSVDGGNLYDGPENLTVTASDGRTRPALASDYTHLRWVFGPSLAPGQQGYVRFRAVLK